MKLTFDEKELARYARMRAAATEFRALKLEIETGQRALPELAKAESSSRAAIEHFPPSKLITFDGEIRAAFTASRRAELVRAAVIGSVSRLQSRMAINASELERDCKELQVELRWKVKAAFPAPGRNDEKLNTNSGVISPACSAAISRVVTVEGDTIADRAETLLALAKEMGAEIPEGIA